MTSKQLTSLQQSGKIKGFTMKKAPKISKEKMWIEETLKRFSKKSSWILEPEYKFHPVRKWKFDFLLKRVTFSAKIINRIVAVEYEGLMSAKSRHTTIKGYSADTEKYNEAALMGITVLRYTALTYKNLEKDLKRIR